MEKVLNQEHSRNQNHNSEQATSSNARPVVGVPVSDQNDGGVGGMFGGFTNMFGNVFGNFLSPTKVSDESLSKQTQ